MSPSSKTRIFSWACFDFANSAFATLVLTFVYNTYFAKGIAPDENTGTMLWGNAVAVASILIAVLSPALGAAADAFAWKKRFMTVATLVACVATAALFIPQKGDIALSLCLFVLALVATELSIVFNNAFLPDLAPRASHGKVSGLAFAFGYAGGLVCLLIALLGFLPKEGELWFGLGRDAGQNVRATMVLVAVWFLVFSLPTLIFLKEKRSAVPRGGFLQVSRSSFARLVETAGRLRELKQLFWMLVARLFYNDGLVAIFSFGGIYATVEFGFTFEDLMIFGIALNVCSGLGALIFSFIEDRIGSRATIVISLLALVAATSAALLVQSKDAFWVCAVVIGLFIGPNQSASRAFLSRLTPADKANEFFGFYAFSGKATAFLGPFLYGNIVSLLDSQRAGMAVIPVLMIVGLVIFLTKANEPKGAEGCS